MLSISNGTHASSAGIDSLESFQCHFNYMRANGLYFWGEGLFLKILPHFVMEILSKWHLNKL